MKTPKEIYLLQKGSQLLGAWSRTPQKEISGGWYSAEYKYIRADLAELTWEDMKQIDLCFHKVAEEQTIGKLKLHSFREMYEEVLHRFLENKKETKLWKQTIQGQIQE